MLYFSFYVVIYVAFSSFYTQDAYDWETWDWGDVCDQSEEPSSPFLAESRRNRSSVVP